MNISMIKKGTRVRVIREDEHNPTALLGKVGVALEDSYVPLIEFDENIGGHSGGDLGADGHVWAMACVELEVVE